MFLYLDNPTLNQKYQENGDVLRLIQDQVGKLFYEFSCIVFNVNFFDD